MLGEMAGAFRRMGEDREHWRDDEKGQNGRHGEPADDHRAEPAIEFVGSRCQRTAAVCCIAVPVAKIEIEETISIKVGEGRGGLLLLPRLVLVQRVLLSALRLLGDRGELVAAAPDAVDGGAWMSGYLFSLSGPIYAGTNEIQRNIIAERVLGLPRK